MTLELSKSIRWSNDHACFAMFELLAHFFTFLISSFLRVSKQNNTEVNHVTDALRVNNYPSYVISNILKWKFSKPPTHAIPTPEDLVCMFFKWAAPHENPNSFAVLPFINGVTLPLTRILRKHHIQVVNKPLKTLQQEFPYTLLLFFSLYFISPFQAYISPFRISFLSVEGCRLVAESSLF